MTITSSDVQEHAFEQRRTQPGALPEVEAFIAEVESRAAKGERIASLDPATGQLLVHVAETNAEEVDRTVRHAHDAFTGSWKRFSPFERERVLHRLADLMEQHATELAQYDALESGKPVGYVEAVDVALAVEQFRYYAGWPTKILGSVVPVASADHLVYTKKDPLGVVAAITPWNFPLCQAAIKIAPALAAGNAVVIKPSELTSLSTLRLAELAVEAGVPEGVVSVVTGRGETTGAALTSHPLVRGITFTGSDRVGRQLAAEAGAALKPISLELGGKNPNIIFPDADVQKAATAAAVTAFFYSGQVCFAGSRVLVHRDVRDDVLDVIHQYTDAIVVGPSLDSASTMGPLVSAQHRDKVNSYVEQARRGAASITRGGISSRDGGFFYDPTIVLDPTDAEAVTTDEIFGPVLIVQTFDDDDDLIARANASRYGLTAGLWTSDVTRVHSIADRLEVGRVWVNTYADWAANAPWGGSKQSGLGRDCGPDAVEKFLETKTVWVG
ncbi:aldehyde dehydrogenase family protein [Ruicaihuangia caeni]|uniref:Aldehyde dehydrogenase family protein n=1 Tax=Ruicaihuangia caeni TaxID=3042517 RepID=A0AAW6T589_9MICO|nr:aldehyde dehydrogenase family protein [Klugiella sp. YN-L-19]MDI2098917.1 aldehyde dehydrogenase family protein [Klugiella sp. YN-L-19]